MLIKYKKYNYIFFKQKKRVAKAFFKIKLIKTFNKYFAIIIFRKHLFIINIQSFAIANS